MNILIDHAGFVSKGAELMLRAVRHKASQLFPGSKFVVQADIAAIPEEAVVRNGFYVLGNPRGKRRLIPNKHTHRYHFIRPSNIDLVLDAGGFQFSDQWINAYSEESNQRLHKYYSTLKSGGAKIIFLPQAAGPFTLPLAVARMKEVFMHADVFYAREQTSYAHLVTLFGEHPKIQLCPDFTNIYKPDVPLTNLLPANEYIGVVPNQKMITHTSTEISGNYLDFMTGLCIRLVENGHRLLLINHEGPGDFEIIKTIKSKLPEDTIVLNNLTAVEIKAVIGRLKALVSSRFHGVVSGLSQQVPTFCTGWSHKYQELLKEYGIEQNLLTVGDIETSYHKIIQAISTPANAFRPSGQAVALQREKVNRMWEAIKLFV